MESAQIKIFNSFPLLSVTLPYYHYLDECYKLMRSVNKRSQKLLEENSNALIRYWVKRELELHYPLFKSLAGPLTTNRRNELYKLRLQLKFPEDYDELKKFIVDNPNTEFSHLHLVIIEDSLEKANEIIDLLRENGTISQEVDETYDKLLSSNYCRAANMTTKLRYESEMVIGAEPKAFIEKVEAVGLLDVRDVSRCPSEEVNFPVYKLKVDKIFCDALEDGSKVFLDTFKHSVQKIIIEEEVKNAADGVAQFIGNCQKTFENTTSFELLLTGNSLSVEQMNNYLTEGSIAQIEYEGLEEDGTVEFVSNKLEFVVGEGANLRYYSADSFMIEILEDKYNVVGDYVFFDSDVINFKVTGKKIIEKPVSYSSLDASGLTSQNYIVHKKHINILYYKDVPQKLPKVVPTDLLKLYISEQEEYTHLDAYLSEMVSDSLPISVELDVSFADNMENTKAAIINLFKKHVLRLEIVQEMQEDEFIDCLYEQVNNSTTLKEMVPILNQDWSKVIEMIKNNRTVEQWIMDVRRPWDEQRDDVVELFRNCKDNSFVLRDYVEFLIEFRFPTSFQINPII